MRNHLPHRPSIVVYHRAVGPWVTTMFPTLAEHSTVHTAMAAVRHGTSALIEASKFDAEARLWNAAAVRLVVPDGAEPDPTVPWTSVWRVASFEPRPLHSPLVLVVRAPWRDPRALVSLFACPVIVVERGDVGSEIASALRRRLAESPSRVVVMNPPDAVLDEIVGAFPAPTLHLLSAPAVAHGQWASVATVIASEDGGEDAE